ncbi:hypothetical protein MAUB_58810 [Mycolicibacterium aubagnense]|uniref:Uncharacterized protein n=1 Tax=Mycolicibacterium aubagnense TaxID=319707 RepID=A0ABM7IMU2_9MYCO|nr:hypothetical protein MAUB_58810 [Mycolicibacterium aubagnense]
MNVAQQFPARTDSNGVIWYRHRDSDSGTSRSEWTSDPTQAHSDYVAHYDATTGGLHPEGVCGGDCSGCCSDAEWR